jgi:hypothetical protein
MRRPPLGILILRSPAINVLKLRSDQTDSVSGDLHQQRLNGDGRLLSFGHTCGRLRRRKIKSRHSRILRHRRQSATSGRSPLAALGMPAARRTDDEASPRDEWLTTRTATIGRALPGRHRRNSSSLTFSVSCCSTDANSSTGVFMAFFQVFRSKPGKPCAQSCRIPVVAGCAVRHVGDVS